MAGNVFQHQPAAGGDGFVSFDFEKTLVHELLHLKFSFWCKNEDDIGDRVMHQMIDDLARALTEKRKCEGNGDGQNRDLQPRHRGAAAKDG